MKTSLKANLLKHLIAKKEEGGFTLIELLVVIIIIGILAAIALPSFLNQANKARQSEAKTYVGSMNRGQQAYRLENSAFAPDFVTLAIGIPSNTTYYNYTIADTGVGGAKALATMVDVALKSYAGGVQLTTGTGGQDATTLAIMCESLNANVAPAVNITPGAPAAATTVTCPNGTFKKL
ncbi:pesticin [filamentous cyanobacterium CCT1]|nr:pesticin [filamentous cyanobacterium CCT1]PSN81526.1 pesticin [filamentous cyanobacterium CCP4]